MSPFRDLEHAREFAARTLAAIARDAVLYNQAPRDDDRRAADHKRIDSDLAGIEERWRLQGDAYRVERDADAARYAAGLVRTGALYGQEP